MLIAYHGKPDLKAAFLAQIAQHEAADQIMRGTYAGTKNGHPAFCAVGCSLESLRVIEGLSEIEHGAHGLYEHYLGVPIMLAHLEDRIFEGLPEADAMAWPRRFSEAIPPGADLSMVGPRFLHDLLTADDGAVQRRCATDDRVKAAVAGVSALFVRWLETGTKPSVTEWREPRSAAYTAADAADAAYAAAYAADAYAAAYAAADAYAAYAAAAYAASAAASADAADARAARSQEFSRQSVSLERLLREAPMVSL